MVYQFQEPGACDVVVGIDLGIQNMAVAVSCRLAHSALPTQLHHEVIRFDWAYVLAQSNHASGSAGALLELGPALTRAIDQCEWMRDLMRRARLVAIERPYYARAKIGQQLLMLANTFQTALESNRWGTGEARYVLFVSPVHVSQRFGLTGDIDPGLSDGARYDRKKSNTVARALELAPPGGQVFRALSAKGLRVHDMADAFLINLFVRGIE